MKQEAKNLLKKVFQQKARAVVIARKLSSGSRIIPGDWGTVGPGWLARPLCCRSSSSGRGGRIHQFLWHVRACQLREKGTWRLGTMRNRSESSQVAWASFEPERIAVTQRVIGCYCASARDVGLWRIQSNRLGPPKENHRKMDKQSARAGKNPQTRQVAGKSSKRRRC
jgi:hypothetical protein